ncbi:serine--pyruvate aminotransferase, mitochondrial [Glossina fuscipes]|uniref:Alanine--glyoxylate aminotransferase n=1 Tax=Glossina fuscipes TaxID=7396 RepID=A0A9C5ZPS9_9MUSC|nr:serine--pyruvate aminotransferase, mitochondrial [Glossina fuscipes]KAI9589081.1 hypothetical protein GQX74_007250 [Glossina fuscipes]
MEIPPPLVLKRPLFVPIKTLMGPGPSNCSQRVLSALSNPVIGHLHSECLQIMNEIKEGIKYIFQTSNDATMCISGSGHSGLESALCNLIEDGDVVLVACIGLWGHRAADIAKRYGGDVRLVETTLGHSLTINEIEIAFKYNQPKIFFTVQGDSSTGVLQSNLKDIGKICRRYNCLFIVDTIASLGGTDFFMDEWFVDVAFTGSQKTLGAPPGLTPISLNVRAIDCINARKTKVKVYYFDILLIGQYWNCFNMPIIYHHTISATLLYGLREALAQVCAEGLKAFIHRHQQCSYRLQKGLKDLGLEMFVKNASERLPTITTIKVPFGIDWRKVIEYIMRKYSMEISGGLGPTVGNVFRIGLMGENATLERADLILNILREAIESSKLDNNEKSKI